MAGRFTIEAVFKAVDRLTGPVRRMQARVGKFTRTFSTSLNNLNRGATQLAGGIKRIGLAAAVVLGITGGLFADMVRTGAEFDRQMGSAAARFTVPIERGTERWEALERAVRNVGLTTEFTATQAAEGAKILAKAGFDELFIMQALAKVVDFTTASEIDFAQAADIASKTMGTFGLITKDLDENLFQLTRVMDVLTRASNLATTTVPELFEALIKGAPQAVDAGQSLETYVAALTAIASKGIIASVAGTGTKNLALALSGVANHAKAIFAILKIPLTEDNAMRDMIDVTEELQEKLLAMSQIERTQFLAGIFGKQPIATASNILKSIDQMREFREILLGAKGATGKLADAIRDDVMGSLFELVSAVASVKLSIFQLQKTSLKDLIDRLVVWIRANEEIIAQPIGKFIRNIIDNWEKYAKTMKKVLLTVGVVLGLALAVSAVAAAASVIAAIVAGGTLAIVAAGVLTIIAAVAALIIWWDELSAGVKNFLLLVGIVVLAFAGIPGLLVAAAAVILAKWEPIKAFFVDLGETIANIFSPISAFQGDPFPQPNGLDAAGRPLVVSPQDRIARSIEETRSTSLAEILLRAEPGTQAEVASGSLGAGIRLQTSGGF